ncbi:17000_t:CDS:2 [Acaulospora morrowiae]|uniref:17000_t:CDS:1 n=1 Tax=Acaulospora morrowiae TaxID=94023 RepID=A0A9N9HET4_9GLOM|nr:17000_t:CDS:2 [Acaulospora morrowiae]
MNICQHPGHKKITDRSLHSLWDKGFFVKKTYLPNSPPPSDDGSCSSDLGYEEGIVGDCYTYESPDHIPSTCTDGLAVYTTEHSNYPIFSLHPAAYLEGSAGNGIIV